MQHKMTSRWAFLAYGMLLSAVVILGIRFATYHVATTHYHANFALYLNGKREQFKGPQYYKEVAACAIDGPIQPAQRAHMHDNINSLIHVHDDGVTWNQFFNNLGWDIGGDYLITDQSKMYQADDTQKLNIVLNGQNLTDLTSIANTVIKDKDRLLVSFGNISTKTVDAEYKSVPYDAAKYDAAHDPASCAGQMEHVTVSDRLKHLF